MAQLKPIKFVVEQFPDQAKWIGPFFSSLNAFTNDVVLALNNSLQVKDNLYQEIKEIKFKNQTTNFPLKFRTKFQTYPQGLLLLNLWDETLSTYASPSVNPWVNWKYVNGEINISAISGLTLNTTYIMKVLVIYG